MSLVAPGLLGTPQEFRRRHGGAGPDPTASVRDIPALQARMREVMVRHRRSDVSVLLPQRLAETVRVAPDAGEAALYAGVADRIRSEARDARPNILLRPAVEPDADRAAARPTAPHRPAS